MPTTNSINSNIPIEISKGGTNASTMATATGIVKYDGTRLVTSATATLDAANIQTNTAQPCFRAYLANAINDVTGNGTNYTVIFDTAEFDNSSSYDVATGLFTAPKTGRYLFNTSLYDNS